LRERKRVPLSRPGRRPSGGPGDMSGQQAIDRKRAGAMDEQHQQHQSPQDVILYGDVGEIGVGHDGDDVENEQQAGGKARAQSERKQDGQRELGRGAQHRRYRRRQRGDVVLVLEQGQRHAPVADLGEPRQKEHARDIKAQAECEQRLQAVDQPCASAIQRRQPAEKRRRHGPAHRGLWPIDDSGATKPASTWLPTYVRSAAARSNEGSAAVATRAALARGSPLAKPRSRAAAPGSSRSISTPRPPRATSNESLPSSRSTPAEPSKAG